MPCQEGRTKATTENLPTRRLCCGVHICALCESAHACLATNKILGKCLACGAEPQGINKREDFIAEFRGTMSTIRCTERQS